MHRTVWPDRAACAHHVGGKFMSKPMGVGDGDAGGLAMIAKQGSNRPRFVRATTNPTRIRLRLAACLCAHRPYMHVPQKDSTHALGGAEEAIFRAILPRLRRVWVDGCLTSAYRFI